MSLRLFRILFSQALERLFSYRVNFWVQFWGSALTEIVIAYLLWSSVYQAQGVEAIGGYTLTQMMVYYLLISFVGRIIRGMENYDISRDIYEGSLTRFLLYPHNYFFFKYADHLSYTVIGAGQAILACVVTVIFFPNAFDVFQFNILSLPVIFISLFFASVFHFMLMTLLELASFWADNVWSLLVMARFVISFFGGFYLPLTLFPESLLKVLKYTPFPSLTYIPIQYLMGAATISELLFSFCVLLVWIVILWALMAVVWGRGQYKFSGVGQ